MKSHDGSTALDEHPPRLFITGARRERAPVASCEGLIPASATGARPSACVEAMEHVVEGLGQAATPNVHALTSATRAVGME